jgi:hypothetical protein
MIHFVLTHISILLARVAGFAMHMALQLYTYLAEHPGNVYHYHAPMSKNDICMVKFDGKMGSAGK